MSAIIGTVGDGGDLITVSVGDGGTVYLTLNDHSIAREADGLAAEWFVAPPQARKLAELIERAARHYDADPRTAAEQALDDNHRLMVALRDLTDDPPCRHGCAPCLVGGNAE